MKICILGDNLSSLALALMLVNKNFFVHLYSFKSKKKNFSGRTIGISKSNIDFLNKEIHKLNKKKQWDISEIEIFSEKIKKEKILNFKKKEKSLFSIIKNDELYSTFLKELKKNRFFKKNYIKENIFYENLLNSKEYNLIFNCEDSNPISKKFFYKKINKNYNDIAFTAVIKHKNLINKTASQIFTKYGPLAFLPISEKETSIVYSINSKKNNFNKKKIIELIKNYNTKYSIQKFYKMNNFKLRSLNLRNYHYKNIISFGDMAHKIHPLAGQGFNMTLRDINIICEIIDKKIDLGLSIDSSIGNEFEKKMKHKNFLFSNGIDLIYEFFNFERKIKNDSLIKILKHIGSNDSMKKLFISYADKGLI